MRPFCSFVVVLLLLILLLIVVVLILVVVGCCSRALFRIVLYAYARQVTAESFGAMQTSKSLRALSQCLGSSPLARAF